jgi:hypothetical protein
MIYSKLDGTTSKKFKLGKNGVELQDNGGKLVIEENDGTVRAVGVSDIRIDGVGDSIPTAQAVNNAVNAKIRTVTNSEVDFLDVTGQIKENDYIFVEKEGGN